LVALGLCFLTRIKVVTARVVFVFVVNNLATITVQCICSCSDGCSKKYRATQCERKHQTKVEHSTTEVWC